MSRSIIPIETEFKFPFGNQVGKVNAFLVQDGNEAVLVDTLVEGKELEIEKALDKAGLQWDALKHIIITHAHPDHTGSLAAILQHAPNAHVYASDAVSAEVPVAKVHDGETVFGLRVIETPGHTHGSISLYDDALSIMLLGDAATNIGGSLSGSPRMFTADAGQATESLRKITALSFDRAFFGHGSSLEGHASEKLKQLVS
jgi:glyoxylase-like metal-dependent hydrolase (beta-lactamase superfamily II)